LRSDILSEDPTLLQRFKLEIKLARKITHKNVLRTHDFGEWAGTPYISMEYLEGVTLKDLQKRKGALPLGVGLQIAKQMCHGLAAAHAQGVVHRDIKRRSRKTRSKTRIPGSPGWVWSWALRTISPPSLVGGSRRISDPTSTAWAWFSLSCSVDDFLSRVSHRCR
jgi:serine/threonine protein kinase